MDTYWLMRSPDRAPEGPFGLEHIRSKYESGTITQEAKVRRRDSEEWLPVERVIQEHVTVRTVDRIIEQTKPSAWWRWWT